MCANACPVLTANAPLSAPTATSAASAATANASEPEWTLFVRFFLETIPKDSVINNNELLVSYVVVSIDKRTYSYRNRVL